MLDRNCKKNLTQGGECVWKGDWGARRGEWWRKRNKEFRICGGGGTWKSVPCSFPQAKVPSEGLHEGKFPLTKTHCTGPATDRIDFSPFTKDHRVRRPTLTVHSTQFLAGPLSEFGPHPLSKQTKKTIWSDAIWCEWWNWNPIYVRSFHQPRTDSTRLCQLFDVSVRGNPFRAPHPSMCEDLMKITSSKCSCLLTGGRKNGTWRKGNTGPCNSGHKSVCMTMFLQKCPNVKKKKKKERGHIEHKEMMISQDRQNFWLFFNFFVVFIVNCVKSWCDCTWRQGEEQRGGGFLFYNLCTGVHQ